MISGRDGTTEEKQRESKLGLIKKHEDPRTSRGVDVSQHVCKD